MVVLRLAVLLIPPEGEEAAGAGSSPNVSFVGFEVATVVMGIPIRGREDTAGIL